MTENGKGQTGVFIAAAAATLLVVVLFSLFTGPKTATSETPDTPQAAHSSNRIEEESFFLYFSEREGRFLTSEERTVSTAKDPWQLSQKIIAALIEGPERGSTRTVPAATRLRAVYITPPRQRWSIFQGRFEESPRARQPSCSPSTRWSTLWPSTFRKSMPSVFSLRGTGQRPFPVTSTSPSPSHPICCW